MGQPMKYVDAYRFADGVARESREFGSMSENLRDAQLAGAENIGFLVHGLGINPKDETPYEYVDKGGEAKTRPISTGHHVARRTIADDGCGMSEDVLTNAYFKFGVTATTKDFAVDVDDAGKVSVSVISSSGGDDDRHARRGLGGRLTISHANPLGVVTVTISDGVARMVWMYRDNNDQPQMRQWLDNDGLVTIVDPYIEPDVITAEEARADEAFFATQMLRDSVWTEDVSREWLTIANDEDEIENPLRGMDWYSVVPEWVGIFNPEDALWYREDGTLAHGTVKVLLGRHSTDSTAITAGATAFPNEADFQKYVVALDNMFADLTPWNVRVQAVKPMRTSNNELFRIIGYPRLYEFDSGTARSTKTLTGRRMHGAIGERTRVYKRSGAIIDPVIHQSVVPLGDYGKAQVVVVDKGALGTGNDDLRGNRKGIVVMVYGNELHPISSTSKDGEVAGHVYRNQGIPTALIDQTSIFYYPPRASDTEDGVYQTYARDSLKWTGRDDLPLGGKDGIYARVLESDLPAELDKLVVSTTKEDSYEVDTKQYGNLIDLMRPVLEGDMSKPEDGASSGATIKQPALLGDSKGADTGMVVGSQGTPGTDPRTPCEECGQVIHADDCSKKPEPRTQQGGAGTKGPVERIDPAVPGKRRGRVSRAMITKPEPKAVTPLVLDPPEVVFTEGLCPDDKALPAVWEHSTTASTGRVVIYKGHEIMQRLYKAGRDTKRKESEVVLVVESWVRRRVRDAVMGTWVLTNRPMGKGAPTWNQTQVTEYMNEGAHWLILMAGMLGDFEALKVVVSGRAARKSTRARKAVAA